MCYRADLVALWSNGIWIGRRLRLLVGSMVDSKKKPNGCRTKLSCNKSDGKRHEYTQGSQNYRTPAYRWVKMANFVAVMGAGLAINNSWVRLLVATPSGATLGKLSIHTHVPLFYQAV